MAVYNAASMGQYGSTWQAKGYAGTGAGQVIDSLRGRSALVCGNGASVFDDLAAARPLLTDPLVFAVNDVGMYLHHVDEWVSLHADNIPAWRAVRYLHPVSGAARIHSYEAKRDVEVAWTFLTPVMALSGYFAMQVAYLMGCSPIVLCGCPGEPGRRFFDAVERHDPRRPDLYGGGARAQVIKEMDRLPEFKAAVRSMSGWTARFFGSLRPSPAPDLAAYAEGAKTLTNMEVTRS